MPWHRQRGGDAARRRLLARVARRQQHGAGDRGDDGRRDDRDPKPTSARVVRYERGGVYALDHPTADGGFHRDCAIPGTSSPCSTTPSCARWRGRVRARKPGATSVDEAGRITEALRVLLLCGGTGLLGGRIAERLAEQRVPFRALVRDGSTFEPPGADVVRGDLRDPASLDAALAGVDTVVTTVTAMTRLLAGGEKTTIDATDNHGTRNLIEAAERAGVTRFLYISFAAIQPQDSYPLGRAKWENEERLRASTMREIILKPMPFRRCGSVRRSRSSSKRAG